MANMIMYEAAMRSPASAKCFHGRQIIRMGRKQIKQLHRNFKVSAGSADNSPPTPMNYESALKFLDLREGASFDEILAAKKKLIETDPSNQELLLQVMQYRRK